MESNQQGQIHFTNHFDEKIEKIDQVVQKIWQGEGTVWRLEEKGRGPALRESS